jgi:hypothetical protein
MSIEVKDAAPVSEQQIRQLVDLVYDVRLILSS